MEKIKCLKNISATFTFCSSLLINELVFPCFWWPGDIVSQLQTRLTRNNMLFCSQVQGRRTQSGQWQYYWSWEWRRNEQQCGDMGLETRHWSTIVTAETADIPRNYSSPLPASIRVTAWCGSCISNLWQHYSNHPAYPLHSVLGTCLHSFLDVSAHFWLGILLSSWVLYFTRILWPPGRHLAATSSHSTPGRVRHCSSVTRVQFTVSKECTPDNGTLQ